MGGEAAQEEAAQRTASYSAPAGLQHAVARSLSRTPSPHEARTERDARGKMRWKKVLLLVLSEVALRKDGTFPYSSSEKINGVFLNSR